MIVRFVAIICLGIAAFSSFGQEPGDDTFDIDIPEGNAALVTIRCAKVQSKTASEATAYFSFAKLVPNYFWEADTAKKRITLTFVNTQLGGFTENEMTDTFNIGPIKTIHLVHERRDRNEAVRGLTPEWYDLVTATIECSPMIKSQKQLEVSQSGTNIYFSFPWPSDPSARNKLYVTEKKSRRAWLYIPLAGVGTAGAAAGGYFLWMYLQKSGSADELDPVLPEHPTVP
jgi:hypothetical protein